MWRDRLIQHFLQTLFFFKYFLSFLSCSKRWHQEIREEVKSEDDVLFAPLPRFPRVRDVCLLSKRLQFVLLFENTNPSNTKHVPGVELVHSENEFQQQECLLPVRSSTNIKTPPTALIWGFTLWYLSNTFVTQSHTLTKIFQFIQKWSSAAVEMDSVCSVLSCIRNASKPPKFFCLSGLSFVLL